MDLFRKEFRKNKSSETHISDMFLTAKLIAEAFQKVQPSPKIDEEKYRNWFQKYGVI